MCLAVPGQIIEVQDDPVSGQRLGVVDFNGSRVRVSLALVSEAEVGSWVLVHAGFALEQLDEQAARETWTWLQEARVGGPMPRALAETGASGGVGSDESAGREHSKGGVDDIEP